MLGEGWEETSRGPSYSLVRATASPRYAEEREETRRSSLVAIGSFSFTIL